jgi:sugar phosphate isomerase/epimerase
MVITRAVAHQLADDTTVLAEATRPPTRGFLEARLGIDHPAGWWPSTPHCKSYEAGGFTYLQVRMPVRSLLADEHVVVAHASALREALDLTGLRLILHAPDDLLAGTPEHDRQLDGALRYAWVAGSELIVYHGARIPIGDAAVRARLGDEERSLRRALHRAATVGVRIAVENLAPVYPGVEYVCHDPSAVADLVRRLDSEYVGMCLDIGHAHIAAELAGCEILDLVEPALEHVLVFHVHDNLGARARGPCRGGIEPLRLDLHLPPGAGTVPWREIAPRIAAHTAPVQLEIHPAGRPEPARLAILTREVFRRATLRSVASAVKTPQVSPKHNLNFSHRANDR